MKNTFRLAFAYLKYYKKQTLALFMGIVLSAALLTGIGSLMASGRTATVEHVREKYGDWHYGTRCDYPWFTDFQEHTEGDGYKVEKSGILKIRKVLEEPYDMALAYADSVYLDMMGRKLEQGYYPRQKNEVAMDAFTLKNLEIPESLGSKVVLDGEEFILSGIVSDMSEADSMQVFVNEELDYGTNGEFLYLKFDESRKVYDQAAKFTRAFGIDMNQSWRNNELLGYVGGSVKGEFLDTIKTGVSMPGAGLPYIWGSFNEMYQLTEKIILAALGIFGTFIIYSLFQISIIKRMSQYSIMQGVGMQESTAFGVLAAELSMIFLFGYPAGILLGTGVSAWIYQKNGKLFVQQEELLVHSGAGGDAVSVADLPNSGVFHVSGEVIAVGAVFFLILIIFICFILVRKMRKLTIRELMISESGKRHKSRKIYSLSTGNLTGKLTEKFMFERKGAFIGILLSLSVGSLIFLGAAYVADNTKINNELKFKADDGLGSDVQVYADSDVLADTIPDGKIEELKNITELGAVHPVRYMLGEIPFRDGTFKWTSYYPEIADEEGFEPNPALMEKYNGIAVKSGEDDYRLKVNIYGYDDEMLKNLEEYLLEGSINPDKMRSENTVIFKTLMGGQGTYEGVDIQPGDKVTLKTPVNADVDQEVLKFLSGDEEYKEQDLQVSALVSRPLAKVDSFIGDDSTNRIDIIMTNEQMEQNFRVAGYQTVSISLKADGDADKASGEIKKIISDVDKCVVKDYTPQIEAQNLFLNRKMLFFYGVALLLLIISLLHIVNSMQYLVAARKHEFGILRAIGITDTGFRKMLLKEGLRYGIYATIVMIVIYLAVQKILYYFMIHVYLYLHPKTEVPIIPIFLMAAVNIVICVSAVLISGQSVLKEQIIEEIRE